MGCVVIVSLGKAELGMGGWECGLNICAWIGDREACGKWGGAEDERLSFVEDGDSRGDIQRLKYRWSQESPFGSACRTWKEII